MGDWTLLSFRNLGNDNEFRPLDPRFERTTMSAKGKASEDIFLFSVAQPKKAKGRRSEMKTGDQGGKLHPPHYNHGESSHSKSSSTPSVRSRSDNGWETDSGRNVVNPTTTTNNPGVMHQSASTAVLDCVDCSPRIGVVSHSSSFSSLQQQQHRRKKSPWYNALYPSYKTRSDDFKKLFTKLPDSERLIVEYSCALQKDILVHGRMYVSKNYLCFYSNILKWETCVRRKWKDVKNITKEKTALVIPNAVEVTTDDGERYFFTSFLARDRSYVMLFKLWQNALLDQPASSTEIWKWIHSEYGDELGLTSEDELDYRGPFSTRRLHPPASLTTTANDPDKRLSSQQQQQQKQPSVGRGSRPPSSSCALEEEGTAAAAAAAGSDNEFGRSDDIDDDSDHLFSAAGSSLVMDPDGSLVSSCDDVAQLSPLARRKNLEQLSPEETSSSDDDGERRQRQKRSKGDDDDVTAALETWKADQPGRLLVSETFPVSADHLFAELFTPSAFFRQFHADRKTFDVVQGRWQLLESGAKAREVSFTLSLTHPLGPKHSTTVETQTLRKDTRPGRIYFVDVDACNSGIPYEDSFYVSVHACVSKVATAASRCSSLTVFAEIKYRKTVWGLVKTFIDKNTWSGLEDFYSSLATALRDHCEDNIVVVAASSGKLSPSSGGGGVRARHVKSVSKHRRRRRRSGVAKTIKCVKSKVAGGGGGGRYSSRRGSFEAQTSSISNPDRRRFCPFTLGVRFPYVICNKCM